MIAERAERGGRTRFALAGACAGYALLLTMLGWFRYAGYHSGADLGEFVQTIATPLSGFGDTPEGGSHFLHHFSPILFLLSPLLLATHSPVALIAIQAVAGALVAPPIYLLVRKRIDERFALGVALVALIYPPLVGVTFTDFHENGLAPAAFLWLAWAVDARRWAIAAAFVAALLCIKEDEALLLAVLGAGFAWSARRGGDVALMRFSLATAVAGVVTLLVFFLVVRPLAGGHDAWFALGYISDPNAQQQGLAALTGRLTFLLEALVPLCFVPLLSRRFAIVVPGLLEVLSSRWSITYTMGQHYAGVWVGAMLAVYALTLCAIARDRSRRVAGRFVAASLAVCALNLAFASPTHWRHYLSVPNAHDAALDRAVASIPANAPVGAHDEIYAHLGFNPAARIGIDDIPEYLIVDRTYYAPAEWNGPVGAHVADVVRRGNYDRRSDDDGVLVYRRR